MREIPEPQPGRGEVRVRMIASPVNPSDLLFIRGRYVTAAECPATPGFEGVGVVDRAGPGLLGKLVLGKRVTVLNGGGGNWAEYAVIPARHARPIPADIPDVQAASFFVNPATALAIVRHVLKVPRGGWLLQSAAGSELGKMIIRLARHDGFHTINIVRRPEAKEELRALGADVVLSTSDGPLAEQILSATRGQGVAYALDCVGGEIGTAVFESLGQQGRMIVFGSLTRDPIRVDPRRMIAGRRSLESFWLGDWMRRLSIPQALQLFGQIGKLMRAGVLTTEPGRSFPLADFQQAVRAAEETGRKGKVLLRVV